MPEIDMDKLKEQLKKHEGMVLHAYQDTLGYWTIGIGHLIDQRKGGYIPEYIALELLETDIDARLDVLQNEPFWDMLDDVRKRVIVEMSFWLGIGGVKRFKKMLVAIMLQDWPRAAAEMLDSKAGRDFPRRMSILAHMMKEGKDFYSYA